MRKHAILGALAILAGHLQGRLEMAVAIISRLSRVA